MSFCSKCGKELIEGAAFCASCGAAAELPKTETVEVEQIVESQICSEQPDITDDNAEMYAEEKECLDNYYKLLKWERISWSITGKVFLIITCVFFGFCALFSTIALATDQWEMLLLAFIYMIYPAMFLPIAIVNRKMVQKTQYYMDTLYTDIRPTLTRCSSVGMIVLSCIFGTMSPVFFIINFARTKGNRHITDRIIAHQCQEK